MTLTLGVGEDAVEGDEHGPSTNEWTNGLCLLLLPSINNRPKRQLCRLSKSGKRYETQ